MRQLPIVLISGVLGTFGCASIVEDRTQSVFVDTPACPAASCRLTNSKGAYFVSSTPDRVVVNRAYGALTVVCEKDGRSATSTYPSSYNESLVGNILLGGPLGFLIDTTDGAGYTYPRVLKNGLRCDAVADKK